MSVMFVKCVSFCVNVCMYISVYAGTSSSEDQFPSSWFSLSTVLFKASI